MTTVTPILLRSFGRSGTTLLMQILGSSNNILFEKSYPFEHRYLTYMYRYSRIPLSSQSKIENWNDGKILSGLFDSIGPMPYETSCIDKKIFQSEILKSNWSAFSKSFNKDDVDVSKPLYYAEKIGLDVCAEINGNLPAKNIYLLRDPRDEYISILNFNKKRGFKSFGAEQFKTDREFAEFIAQTRKGHVDRYLNQKEDQRNLKLTYKDLIVDPTYTILRLENWLGLKLNHEQAVSNDDVKNKHITSSSVSSSIDRWKKEMPLDILDIFQNIMGDQLENLETLSL